MLACSLAIPRPLTQERAIAHTHTPSRTDTRTATHVSGSFANERHATLGFVEGEAGHHASLLRRTTLYDAVARPQVSSPSLALNDLRPFSCSGFAMPVSKHAHCRCPPGPERSTPINNRFPARAGASGAKSRNRPMRSAPTFETSRLGRPPEYLGRPPEYARPREAETPRAPRTRSACAGGRAAAVRRALRRLRVRARRDGLPRGGTCPRHGEDPHPSGNHAATTWQPRGNHTIIT